jgi:DMSO reductase anchor subunit
MARLGVGAVGGLLLPLLLTSSMAQLSPSGQLVFLASSAAAVLAGELLERMLFFKALSAPKMPGAIG